jgi:deazaflavin-dependent oxidoreductase (nitroreductase family)
VLEVIGTGSAPGGVIVIAGLGRSADWYRNLLAHPAVEVAIARQRFRPAHRVLSEPEAVAVLAAYERHHRSVTPVVRRTSTWLVGWDYDGTEDAWKRMAHQLPLIAFRPDGR